MAGLGPLASGIAQVLTRTILLQTTTPNGIPIPLAILDVVNDEKPVFTATVTEHPVEQGPEITDHIQLKNPTLQLKGKMSNTPLDISVAIANTLAGGYAASQTTSQARTNLLNTGLSQGTGIVGAALMSGSANIAANATAGALDAISRTILLTAFQNKTPFDVITKRYRYKNMVIESLSFPRSESTGYALDFEMNLKQVRIVSSLSTQKTQLDEKVISGASSSTNIGSQSTASISTQLQSQITGSNLSSSPGVASKFGVA
jgi:hypothetical protein